MPFKNLDELDSLVDSLILSFELEQGQQKPKSQVACSGTTETEGRRVETGEAELSWKQKGVPKHTYKLHSPPALPGKLSPDRMIEWV